MKASTFQKILRCVKIHYWMKIPEAEEDQSQDRGPEEDYEIDSDGHWIRISDTESECHRRRIRADSTDEEYDKVLAEELQDAEQLAYEISKVTRVQTMDPHNEVGTDDERSPDQ
jgi:hypothetical protein